ncbi:MAG: hypothetical protein OEQ53_18440, partial [Saprospiraceae bacterium]|nr:hypothetical protein [Saprospiraceae bacterium]
DNLLQAQSIDPNDPLVISVGSSYNFYAGKLEEALRLGELALSMDPLEAAHYFSLGLNCYFLKRYDESLQYLEQYNILKPEAAIHHGISSIVYTLMEDFQKALEEAEKETSDEFRLFARSNAYYGLGQTELSDSLLHDYIDKYASASKNIVAVCYAFRHDYDKAFFWLDKAFEEDEGSLYESINYVYFSNLYDDPRWGQLIEKMKLPSGHWLVERMNEGRK